MIGQSALGYNQCRFVHFNKAEQAMAQSLLRDSDYFMKSEWALREQIRQESYRQHGPDIQVQDIFKLDAFEQSKRALQLMVAQELAYQGVQSLRISPDFHLKLRQRLSFFMRSRHFEYFGMASSIYFVATHGGLPFLPEFRFLKLKAEELNTLILNGVDSPEGQAIVREKARSARLQSIGELARRAYLVLTMAVAMYILSDEIDKEDEKAAREAFIKLFNHYNKVLESKQEVKTKLDLHYELTLTNLENKYQRHLTSNERSELCQIINSPQNCR